MIKLVTNFGILMRLAKEESEAKKLGDKERIKKAEEEHESYRQLCLMADSMTI